MAGYPAGEPPSACNHHVAPEELISFSHKWYFTREEIDNHSPSRKDEITNKQEAHLRRLYCSYLQELGMEIKVPQTTIATAMMFCHRFYMRQSHSKNHWMVIAAASILLSSKAEETPRFLRDIVFVAYKLAYKSDPLALERIRQREMYVQQRETILLGETLLLVTLDFELSVELPYKPLVAAAKKLGVLHGELIRVAWNYVNDFLPTTLCLEYKPHYIAAGSLCLAAMRLKLKLPSTKGEVWWTQFEVSPKKLEEAIQRMRRFVELYQKLSLPSTGSMMSKSESKSIDSVVAQHTNNIRTQLDTGGPPSVLSESHKRKQCFDYVQDDLRKAEGCQISDHTGSPNNVAEDGDNAGLESGQSKIGSFDIPSNKIDVHGIRERLKRRRVNRNTTDKKFDMETRVLTKKTMRHG